MILQIYQVLLKKKMLVKLVNEKENEMSRTISISEKIIEINNKMMDIDNRDALLELILKKAIEVVEYAESGSVMFLKSDGNCEFVAAVGYDLEKLKKVEFNVQDTFIYRRTNGSFDKAHITIYRYEFLSTGHGRQGPQVRPGASHRQLLF